MDRFPRNLRDNLRVSSRTLLGAAVVIVLLFLVLIIAYTAFDLGAALPRRRP
jgi:hypothetical protein